MKKKKNESGIQYNKKKAPTPKKMKQNLKKWKLNASSILAIIIGIILFILSLILLGLFFTIIMVVGIILIICISNFIKKLRKKRKTRIIINIILIIMLLLCIGGSIVVGWFFYYVVSHAPDFDVTQLERSESTLVYDNKLQVIAELGTEKREIITYDEISQVFIDALVATEDSRYFQHNGFDAARFLKASIGQVAGASGAGGASTLSMQVVKINFTDATLDSGFQGIVRKFTDIYLAVFKLEKNYSKQEIIEFYVNNNYMGNSSYGIEQASQSYFGKSARELNLAEASLLAGLFKSPTSLDPYKNPEGASDRRATVLNLMVMHGYITEEERDLANSIPVTSLLIGKSSNNNVYQSYIDVVVEEISDRYGVNPYNTPMLIYTNMDTEKQAGIDDIFNGKTYSWTDDVVQAGIAVVDVDNGKIVAIGGGRNKSGILQLNYATGIKRQIGSTAKPLFDYGPGMEYNNWSTYTMFEDKEYYYSSGQAIRNSDREYWGWITLRKSLAFSRNVPALQAFQQVDNQNIINFVTTLGITPEIDKYGNIHEAHSIGAFTGSNALEMAAAYAAFANGGTYYEPYSVNKVVFRSTGEEYEYKSTGVKAMSDSTAFMITDVLKTAVNEGLSSGAKVSGVNVAAKTGTTNYPEELLKAQGYPTDIVSNSWVVGYDPDYAIGLWYGYPQLDKTYNLKQTVSVVERGRLFRAVGNIVFTKNGQDFKVPNSVVRSAVELETYPAALPSENTPPEMISYEYFKVGTEPTEISSRYAKLKDVTNLSVTYNPTTLTVNLSWSKANKSANEQESYGNFGYKVYKDNTYIGFTENNYYIITDEIDPFGVYTVVTTYENYDQIDSPGATFELKDDSIYTVELLVPLSRIYTMNEELDSWDIKPSSSDIQLYKNGESVSGFKSIISIKNSNGDIVANIATTENEEYTISYTVSYNDKEVANIIRKVIIE